jgi:glycerol kinase
MSKNLLTKNQIALGAKHLAIVNVGMESDANDKEGLLKAWNKTQYAFSCDEQDDELEKELKYWQNLLNNGDKFATETVLKAMPWIVCQ